MKRDVWFVFLFVVTGLTIIQALSFSDNNQANFDNGTYVNTTYNGSALILAGGNLTGTFTSRIFDAGSESVWNNLTFDSETPFLIRLVAVDGAADIWKSVNSGSNWSLIADNYNYIIEGDQDVWKSVDGGTSFTKLVSNFNGGNGVVFGLTINSTGALFAVDGAADVWNSLDQGVIWNLVKDDF